MKNLIAFTHRPNTHKLFKLFIRSGILVACASILSGCLLTSPFWNQEFSSHTANVPLQAWTTNKNQSIDFECSKAYHGGLYPAFGPESWALVSSVMPEQSGSLDPLRGKIYSASRDASLPAACWRLDPANNVWYAAIRAKQNGNTYNTFDKTGLECLGREIGKATSWFGWINKGCTKTYSNSNNNIPYVIFRAKP